MFIGFIFLGTLIGWLAAGAALVMGAGLLTALGWCMLMGTGTAIGLAALSFACPRRREALA